MPFCNLTFAYPLRLNHPQEGVEGEGKNDFDEGLGYKEKGPGGNELSYNQINQSFLLWETGQGNRPTLFANLHKSKKKLK